MGELLRRLEQQPDHAPALKDLSGEEEGAAPMVHTPGFDREVQVGGSGRQNHCQQDGHGRIPKHPDEAPP